MQPYSTINFPPHVRDHLMYYNIKITRPLTESEEKGIEVLAANYTTNEDNRKAYANTLKRSLETVCNVAVLALDKAEAIGRVQNWFGDRIAKGEWRMVVD